MVRVRNGLVLYVIILLFGDEVVDHVCTVVLSKLGEGGERVLVDSHHRYRSLCIGIKMHSQDIFDMHI